MFFFTLELDKDSKRKYMFSSPSIFTCFKIEVYLDCLEYLSKPKYLSRYHKYFFTALFYFLVLLNYFPTTNFEVTFTDNSRNNKHHGTLMGQYKTVI